MTLTKLYTGVYETMKRGVLHLVKKKETLNRVDHSVKIPFPLLSLECHLFLIGSQSNDPDGIGSRCLPHRVCCLYINQNIKTFEL